MAPPSAGATADLATLRDHVVAMAGAWGRPLAAVGVALPATLDPAGWAAPVVGGERVPGPVRGSWEVGHVVVDLSGPHRPPRRPLPHPGPPDIGLAIGYHCRVTKTSVEIDRDIAREAAAILGTTTLRDTIDASLREVVNAKRRLELVSMLAEEGRFDFDAAERSWGADE